MSSEDTDACDLDILESEFNEKNDDANEFKKSYKALGLLGYGTYGNVYKGRRLRDNALVAIKRVRRAEIWRWEIVGDTAIPAEVIILQKLASVAGIAKLLEYFDCGFYYLLVIETTDSAVDFHSYVEMQRGVREDKARIFIREIINSLTSCYDTGIVHRDVKLDNIIIDTHTEEIKLIDFGNATYVKEEPFKGVYGSNLFYPPESHSAHIYSSEDLTVWSVGTILYEMLCRTLPFHSVEEIIGKELKFGIEISLNCEDFIRKCLSKDRSGRFKLKDLILHPFLLESD